MSRLRWLALAGWVILVSGLSPFLWREVGDEPAQVHPVWDLSVQLCQHIRVEEEVEVGDLREVRFEADAEVALAEADLNTLPRSTNSPTRLSGCPPTGERCELGVAKGAGGS